jgi:xylose isomerase
MRTYLILKDKARRFREDVEIQALLAQIRGAGGAAPPGGRYTAARAAALRRRRFDRQALHTRALPYERLDQLVVELLLGAR